MTDWMDQEAKNQTIFREMNEWTMEEGDAGEGNERTMDTLLVRVRRRAVHRAHPADLG
jgi:hypothetical protein